MIAYKLIIIIIIIFESLTLTLMCKSLIPKFIFNYLKFKFPISIVNFFQQLKSTNDFISNFHNFIKI